MQDKKSFRQGLKEYFEYHSNERKGILGLMVLIVAVMGINILIPYFVSPERGDFSKYESLIKAWEAENKKNRSLPAQHELFSFDPNTLDSAGFRRLGLTARQTKTLMNYRRKGGRFKEKNDLAKIYGIDDSLYHLLSPYISIPAAANRKSGRGEVAAKNKPRVLFSFDPNTLPYDSLLLLGFSGKLAGQIVHYREKGGRFKTKESLLKIYSMDTALYESLKDYIVLKTTLPEKKSAHTERRFPENKSELMVELNGADTLDLQQLYGIGPGFARKIVKYRDLLGGYYRKEQLLEVYGMDKERYGKFEKNIYADTLLIRKININKASLKQLIRHPYIDYSIAKRIVLLRKQKGGKFQKVSDLREIDMLYDSLFRKIRPYLSVGGE